MPKSYDDIIEEVSDEYEPEDYYDYDAWIEDIRNEYGSVVEFLDFGIDESDPRFTINSS
jgi:hypothetical protein